MTKLAVVHPTTLLGKELRERLDEPGALGDDLVLLTTDEGELGTLTEVRGGAAIVGRADALALEGIDVAFFAGPRRPAASCWPRCLPTPPLSCCRPTPRAPTASRSIAGVNLEAAQPGQVLISPHPGAIALAHLLHPLAELGLEEARATLVQPASMREEAALHELFEQARKALNFGKQQPGIFGHQLVFNLLPIDGDADALVGQLNSTLGEDLDVAVQIVQGGVFHGFSISLYVRFASDPGGSGCARRSAAHPTSSWCANRSTSARSMRPTSPRCWSAASIPTPATPAATGCGRRWTTSPAAAR